MEVPVESGVRRDRGRVLIDASTVEGIKKRRKVVVDGHESEDEENRTDHSMLQYCSDDEENRSVHRVAGFGSDDDEERIDMKVAKCMRLIVVVMERVVIGLFSCFSEMGGGRSHPLRSATPSEMADLEGIQFFTIILEKSSSREVLPGNFVKMLDGHRPQNMKVRQAYNGLHRLWDVEAVFDTDASMYLDRGWKQFVRAYDLRNGYFLVFRYDDNTMFTVKVFDTTMCRMHYQDDDDASTLCLFFFSIRLCLTPIVKKTFLHLARQWEQEQRVLRKCYSKSSTDCGYSKISSDSGYSNNSSKDEEERSGEEEEQSRDDEVHHLKIIHGKDDKVKPEANHWKTNDVQEGRTNEVQEGSGVINDDPEYNPKEDEVVVHKTVKESRTKRPGVKKTANIKRKSSEASVAMPPGRVMAPPPGQTKRILETDEPVPDRFTRQKATMVAVGVIPRSVTRLEG
ncbi:B3 domain-containing protein [Hordeum vulgare]|nr:B3 domain-containing protein [Hordeum vulgare]